jgi:hypothetical protein
VVTVVIATLWGFVGGIFGVDQHPAADVLLAGRRADVLQLFVRLFPAPRSRRVAKISELAAAKISAWLGGQMLLGLIIGTMSAIGYFFMGVPYFFVLAVICRHRRDDPDGRPAAVGDSRRSLVALTVSRPRARRRRLLLGLQLIENNVLVPKVMGETVGLSAVTVIASLAIGSELLGFVGALLAVPTAAIIQVSVEELYLRERSCVKVESGFG